MFRAGRSAQLLGDWFNQECFPLKLIAGPFCLKANTNNCILKFPVLEDLMLSILSRLLPALFLTVLHAIANPTPAGGAGEFYTPEADKVALANATASEEGLPKVLIIGDSISIGYFPAVREALRGKASVSRPNTNCGDTPRGLRHLEQWIGDTKWDVIHFNWGLWDLCYRNPESKNQGNRDKVNGKLSVTPEDYEKNLNALVDRLQKTGASLIWASTTLVPDGEAGRFVGDDAKYNAVAAKIMTKRGIPINDLYATSAAFDPLLFTKPGDVHFKKAGSEKLAAEVVRSIQVKLPAVSAPPATDR
jgi:hypothetical protein